MCSYFYCLGFTPTQQYMHEGDEILAGVKLPEMIKKGAGVYWRDTKSSHLDMEVKLFGLIPIKRVMVSVVAPQTVIPGGQSIGVLLHAEGVMVVGEAPVQTKSGQKNPAKEQGVAVGDLLLKVNQERLTGEYQLQRLVDKCGRQGQTIDLLVKHGQQIKTVTVKPVLCKETGLYRIGLFVKDSTAGVGTLTFYDPTTKSYGALGHIINGFTQDGQVSLHQGKIVEATVKGLQPGKKGTPGEKLGTFKGATDIMGSIDRNTKCGIFGKLEKMPINNPYYATPMPVALGYQIRPGEAEILTVLDDNKISSFAVKIEQVSPDSANKGLVIKVIDRELIKQTGGIIQGMSGSPIIQNGMLVGAVTHVFINDPTKGYGVLAEKMLRETNLLNSVSCLNHKNFENIAG